MRRKTRLVKIGKKYNLRYIPAYTHLVPTGFSAWGDLRGDYWKERRKSMREVPSSRLNFLRRR